MGTEAQASGWIGPSRRRVPRFPMQTVLDVTVLRSGIPDRVPGRSLNVGELIPGVVIPDATLLTSCITSKVTKPPVLTRGVTSMITPVCW